ncbi:entry exclusion lipoprotein TrbK [Pseudoduganella lurida]|uniref:entry exclusion lipoprotein TrbK n=1 Tax=Pseudoduganella lurida TaxID=1036180 RepID=UPI00119DB229
MKPALCVLRTVALFASVACVCACSDHGINDDALPEATAISCQKENIDRIQDKRRRNKMIDMCARRPTFEQSVPRTW